MGEILSDGGNKPDPKKIAAVNNLSRPCNKTELQKFLGMATYLAKFVPNFSEKTAPLRSLLHKSTVWLWSEPQEVAWLELKTLLTSAPVLLFYNPNKPVRLSADSSKHSLGAVLMQQRDDKTWGPVAYASRALNSSEQNYCQLEKELLAVSFACTRFHQFVHGLTDKPFNVLTDHKPLINIFNKELNKCPLRVQRMMLSLQKYNFTLVFVPGKFMYTADVLSRFVDQAKNNSNAMLALDNNMSNIVDNYVNLIVSAISVSMPKAMLDRLISETQTDMVLIEVLKYIRNGWPTHRNNCNALAKRFWDFKDELSFAEGIILRGQRVVIPSNLRTHYLDRIHTGHLGETKCLQRARETIFWPGFTTDVINVVSSCETCQKFRPQQTREPLQPHANPELPYDIIAIDLCSCLGKDYLVIVDYYSSYPEVFQLNKSTASSAVITPLKSCFARWGKPVKLISDNGPQLVSAEFENFCRS